MKDVMIDIETLGTRQDALVIQIGACYFDRATGEIGLGFSVNIHPGKFTDNFTTDYETMKWWFEQSDDARRLVMEAPRDIEEALLALQKFLDKRDVNIWCHATFDMPIILHAFKVVGLKFPIHYRRMRDIRSLMDLSNHKSEIVREGVHHNALDDAKFQAKYCSEAMAKLGA